MDIIIKNHQVDPRHLLQIIQALPVDAMLFMLRAMLPVLFTSKLQMAATVLSQPPDADDEEDGDEPEEEAKSETPNAADPIPDWLKEVAAKDRQSPEQTPRPEPVYGRETASQQQNGTSETPTPGAGSCQGDIGGSGQGLDPELLRTLLKRMLLDRLESNAAPIAKRSIGDAGREEPPILNEGIGEQTVAVDDAAVLP
jgi:hypothetical protein